MPLRRKREIFGFCGSLMLFIVLKDQYVRTAFIQIQSVAR